MSGSVKAGLLFALAALVLTAAVSWIPTVGALCCGPLLALGLGVGAGYLGLRWSEPGAGIGQGILAGGLTGAGALIGSIVFFVAAIAMLSTMPEFEQIFQQALEQQAPGTNLAPDELRTMLGLAGPAAGVCVGSFGLLFALAGGALGGWLARRQSPPPAAPLPPSTLV
jgi:hypothetical protein